jgi:hypothetical protein
MVKKKIQIGDIFELKTPKGLVYLQYIYNDVEYGYLIRVLPGFFDARPKSFSDVGEKKELYFVFFPVQAALNREIILFISKEKVPDWAKDRPLMRRPGGRSQNGKILNWWLSDGHKETQIDSLNEKQRKLSIAVICNDTMLVQRICEGWLPEFEQ